MQGKIPSSHQFNTMNIVSKIRGGLNGGSGSSLQGVLLLLIAFFIFSVQDVIVKLMSSDYAVLEIVTIRSLFALPIVIMILTRSGQTFSDLKTEVFGTQFVRGIAMFAAYLFFFLALAALPYSLMIGIFFSGPLFITALSVPMLGESVGWRRWLAVLIGFVGVLIVINPREGSFDPTTLLAVAAALCYAISIVLTRKISDSPQVIASWTTFVYIGCALILSPVFARLSWESGHPSVLFLTKAWTVPPLNDILLIFFLALCWGGGMVLLSAAYRNTAVAILAPFEYFSIVYGILFGFLIWREVPTIQMLFGVAIIIGSGLFIIYRENQTET